MSIAADFPFGQSSFPPRQVAPANTFTELRPEYTEQSVVQRFEQQVEQYSNRLTVKGASGALTYQALNQAANRVAHAIIDRSGTSPEPVTVPLEHDSPQIMAILGALKAGKFYVPLDRAQPRARLAEILAESQASLILAEHRTLDAANSLAGDEMLVVQVDHLDPGSPTANIGLSLPPDAGLHPVHIWVDRTTEGGNAVPSRRTLLCDEPFQLPTYLPRRSPCTPRRLHLHRCPPEHVQCSAPRCSRAAIRSACRRIESAGRLDGA